MQYKHTTQKHTSDRWKVPIFKENAADCASGRQFGVANKK